MQLRVLVVQLVQKDSLLILGIRTLCMPCLHTVLFFSKLARMHSLSNLHSLPKHTSLH